MEYAAVTERIRNDLCLSEKRMAHTMGVVRASLMLAQRHFPDLPAEWVEIAALMHDYTKEYTVDRQLALCAKYGISLSEEEKAMPKLLHGRTAAEIARDVYGLNDEICSAIRWHTTGRPAMSPLETILYFADYIEDTRTFPECVKLRSYYEKQYAKKPGSLQALYKGLAKSFDVTIRDLLASKKLIDRMTVEARNYYLSQI